MDTVLRVLVIYVFLLMAMRVLGKREFSQLSSFDFVTLLVISEIVQQSMVGDDFSLINAIIGLCTLMILVFLTSIVSHVNPKFEKLVAGTPSVLVHNGAWIPDNLNRERVSPDEVMAELRKAGYEHLDQIRWAILEADGHISFVPHASPARPNPRHEGKAKVS